jgi:hypothetical protein
MEFPVTIVKLAGAVALLLWRAHDRNRRIARLRSEAARFSRSILVGVLMFRKAPPGPRDFGRVLIGLGTPSMSKTTPASGRGNVI